MQETRQNSFPTTLLNINWLALLVKQINMDAVKWNKSHQQVDGAANLLVFRLISLHTVPEIKKRDISVIL